MTNFEAIKDMSLKELADFLCTLNRDDCSECIASKYCYRGHNGMPYWLEAEHEE